MESNKGEKIAIEYLKNKSYLIIDTNVRFRQGEIDIIAQDGEYTVFVEVRHRQSNAFGGATASVDYKKQRKIKLAAEMYISNNNTHNKNYRFDVVAITGDVNGNYKIEHITNAFQ
jgi:putative endonuclease